MRCDCFGWWLVVCGTVRGICGTFRHLSCDDGGAFRNSMLTHTVLFRFKPLLVRIELIAAACYQPNACTASRSCPFDWRIIFVLQMEERLCNVLTNELKTTCITISHRPALVAVHQINLGEHMHTRKPITPELSHLDRLIRHLDRLTRDCVGIRPGLSFGSHILFLPTRVESRVFRSTRRKGWVRDQSAQRQQAWGGRSCNRRTCKGGRAAGADWDGHRPVLGRERANVASLSFAAFPRCC